MEMWMLLWVRRVRHAVRSGRFGLSLGEVKNLRLRRVIHKYFEGTTTGLVNSGNSVLQTITIYEGYNRHAILHSSVRVVTEGFMKVLTEQGYSFIATIEESDLRASR